MRWDDRAMSSSLDRSSESVCWHHELLSRRRPLSHENSSVSTTNQRDDIHELASDERQSCDTPYWTPSTLPAMYGVSRCEDETSEQSATRRKGIKIHKTVHLEKKHSSAHIIIIINSSSSFICPKQCSRKRVQQLKKRKKSCFLDFEKRKKT